MALDDKTKKKKKNNFALNLLLVGIGLALLGGYLYFFGHLQFPREVVYAPPSG